MSVKQINLQLRMEKAPLRFAKYQVPTGLLAFFSFMSFLSLFSRLLLSRRSRYIQSDSFGRSFHQRSFVQGVSLFFFLSSSFFAAEIWNRMHMFLADCLNA